MDRKHRIFWKVVGSGLLGIGIFVVLFAVAIMLLPRSDHPDVVQGWAAGFLLIIDVALSMFLSGAIAMFLTFNDNPSWKYDLAVPFCSGLIAAIPALLLALLFALFSPGMFVFSMIIILICLAIAELGGLTVYAVMATIKAWKEKS